MNQNKPYILITNDDGIHAPGIHALHDALTEIAEIVVVAPATEMSAVGHAITLSDPLRVCEYRRDGKFFGHAVSGTPADCVKIACWALLDRKPDLVISGINLGPNTGINTIYSGTVSAATEGAILQIPSFAISLGTYQNPDFTYAAQFACKFAPKLLEYKLPPGVLLNVNIPPCPASDIQGVAITRQGRALYRENFDKRSDPHNRVYYWLTGEKIDPETSVEVDDGAMEKNMISITPIHFDLTHYGFLEELKGWDI